MSVYEQIKSLGVHNYIVLWGMQLAMIGRMIAAAKKI